MSTNTVTECVLQQPLESPPSKSQGGHHTHQAQTGPLSVHVYSTVTDCSGVRESFPHVTFKLLPVPHLRMTRGALKQSAVVKLSAAVRALSLQHRECEILSGISYSTFLLLTQFVENNSVKFLRKPRLTYLVEDGMVIIQLPSRTHDAPIEELAVLFREHESASHSQRLRVSTSTNYKIVTKTINGIPDLLVSVSSMKAKLLKHLLIFECAFSQHTDSLFMKAKSLAAALPDIHMVFLLQIHEQSAFHSPGITSAAWERFARDPFPLDLPQFLQSCEEEEAWKNDHAPVESWPEEFMGPVTAGGHTWCNISHVQYYVWLRKDNGKLEINPESITQTQWSAYGELPASDDSSDMNHVTEVMNRGLAAIRAAIMETHQSVYEQIQIPVDASLFTMPIVLPPTWDHFRSSLTEAKSHCAFERYQTWYLDSFRGKKRTLSDSEYIPSSQEEEL